MFRVTVVAMEKYLFLQVKELPATHIIGLKEQLDLLTEKSKTYRSQLRFSPNYISPEEIVRYYLNQSSYKDYRCNIAWSKVAFSAYGDVHSCPHYPLGNISSEGGGGALGGGDGGGGDGSGGEGFGGGGEVVQGPYVTGQSRPS